MYTRKSEGQTREPCDRDHACYRHVRWFCFTYFDASPTPCSFWGDPTYSSHFQQYIYVIFTKNLSTKTGHFFQKSISIFRKAHQPHFDQKSQAI